MTRYWKISLGRILVIHPIMEILSFMTGTTPKTIMVIGEENEKVELR
mgnify:CR=1 FL=1|jgi:hypothetical protein